MSDPKEVTTKHKVLKEGLTHDRKECKVGDQIDLTEQQRQALVKREFIADDTAGKKPTAAEIK